MLHLFEEETIEVRSVNRDMAQRACLILLSLVMEGRGGRSAGIDGERVALQAHQVYLAALKQTRIGRTMWSVAGNASFGFDRRMFVHKGSSLFRVALETDGITGSRGPQLPGLKPAVGIVTITALHHAFIDTVMEGAIELLFGF